MPSWKGYPCVPLMCSNCGNTVFYNVVVLGIADLVGAQVNKVSEVVKQEAGRNAWRTPASATSSKHAFDRIDSIMHYSDSSKDC